MATDTSAAEPTCADDLQHFEALESYFVKVGTGSMGKHHMFSLCVKASACKCFEFNLAARQGVSSENSFFAMSSLRGICEDLIVLRYIKRMPASDRELLISALLNYETSTRVKLQGDFFGAFRPQQPVLWHNNIDAAVASSEAAVRAVFNRHGWPNLKKGAIPQIRQIAEKQSNPLLTILYDYLYRLTSGGVHFSVQSLLRSGWGDSPGQVKFSTKNFRPYFTNYCTTYGAFMFCLYFEFFRPILKPGREALDSVAKIREILLMTPRWPEMVTFEEMNLKGPKGPSVGSLVLSAIQATMRKRLISGSANYKSRSSSERQFTQDVFKILLEAEKPRPDVSAD